MLTMHHQHAPPIVFFAYGKLHPLMSNAFQFKFRENSVPRIILIILFHFILLITFSFIICCLAVFSRTVCNLPHPVLRRLFDKTPVDCCLSYKTARN